MGYHCGSLMCLPWESESLDQSWKCGMWVEVGRESKVCLKRTLTRKTSVLCLPLGVGDPMDPRGMNDEELRSSHNRIKKREMEVSYTFFTPKQTVGRIGSERHRKQGRDMRAEHEHSIQHELACIDAHMGYSKAGTMGWHDLDLDVPWQLPMDWYIPAIGGERMTGCYTVLEQRAVVVCGPLV